MRTRTCVETTEDLLETIRIQIKLADRTITEVTKGLSRGRDTRWFVDDLQKAQTMKHEAEKILSRIEDNPSASFERHIESLRKWLVDSVIASLSHRNLMNSTSNGSNMADLHELTAKAALASNFFELR